MPSLRPHRSNDSEVSRAGNVNIRGGLGPPGNAIEGVGTRSASQMCSNDSEESGPKEGESKYPSFDAVSTKELERWLAAIDSTSSIARNDISTNYGIGSENYAAFSSKKRGFPKTYIFWKEGGKGGKGVSFNELRVVGYGYGVDLIYGVDCILKTVKMRDTIIWTGPHKSEAETHRHLSQTPKVPYPPTNQKIGAPNQLMDGHPNPVYPKQSVNSIAQRIQNGKTPRPMDESIQQGHGRPCPILKEEGAVEAIVLEYSTGESSAEDGFLTVGHSCNSMNIQGKVVIAKSRRYRCAYCLVTQWRGITQWRGNLHNEC
uniref:Uncharacterized protein n=1 Tax=Lotharella oceanica TaxID=641309 RepID=A0A7S2TTS7_9EUKA